MTFRCEAQTASCVFATLLFLNLRLVLGTARRWKKRQSPSRMDPLFLMRRNVNAMHFKSLESYNVACLQDKPLAVVRCMSAFTARNSCETLSELTIVGNEN